MQHLIRSKLLSIVSMLVVVSCSPTQASTPVLTDPPSPTAILLPTNTPTFEPTPLLTETPAPTLIPPTSTPVSLELTSAAFDPGEMIPHKHARRGEDISPPLEWSDPPEDTQTLALLVYSDPLLDGQGNWVQWILYNIPPETMALPEAVTPDADGRLSDGSQHHENSWGELKYGGPAPPHVQTFKYYFQIYALDTTLDLTAVEKALDEAGELPWYGVGKVVFMTAIEGHVLAQGELVGKYQEQED